MPLRTWGTAKTPRLQNPTAGEDSPAGFAGLPTVWLSPFRSRLAHPKLQPRKGNRPHVMHSLLSISCMQQPCALPSMSPPSRKSHRDFSRLQSCFFFFPSGCTAGWGELRLGRIRVCALQCGAGLTAVRPWGFRALYAYRHSSTGCGGGGGEQGSASYRSELAACVHPKVALK